MKNGMAAVLCICFFCVSIAGGEISGRFPERAESKTFQDVVPGEWYYENVALCCRTGLMVGTGDGVFSPGDPVTVAQGIAVAARMHMQYNQNELESPLEQGRESNWFSPYYKYSLDKGILLTGEYQEGAESGIMSRALFVTLISRVFPENEFQAVLAVGDIPDVDMNTPFGRQVHTLYQAGVLSGAGADGSFLPEKGITRAEMAAVICRIIRPDTRIRTNAAGAPKALELAEQWVLALDPYEIAIKEFKDGYIIAMQRDTGWQGVFDTSGRQLLFWNENGWYYGDGIFMTHKGFGLDTDESQEVFYYLPEGQRINEIPYYRGTPFSGGYAAVQLDKGQMHLISAGGGINESYAIPGYSVEPSYPPSGGYVWLHPEEPGLVQTVDVDGEIVSYEMPFLNKTHLLNLSTSKPEILNYVAVSHFFGGYARVREVDAFSRQITDKVVDTSLNVVYSNEKGYQYEFHIGGGSFVVSDNERQGVIDAIGNIVLPLEYEAISAVNSDMLLLCRKEGDSFLIQLPSGETVLELPQAAFGICRLYGRLLLTEENDNITIMDTGGQPLCVIEGSGAELYADMDKSLIYRVDGQYHLLKLK